MIPGNTLPYLKIMVRVIVRVRYRFILTVLNGYLKKRKNKRYRSTRVCFLEQDTTL